MSTPNRNLDLSKTEECVCFNLRKTSRAVTQLYDRALKASGLRVTQFTILVVVTRAESITITRLSQLLVMDRTTLTRNLQPLQKQGLIEISPGEDKRTRYISVTDEGVRALERALPLWRTAQQYVQGGIGKMDFYLIRSTLEKAVELALKS